MEPDQSLTYSFKWEALGDHYTSLNIDKQQLVKLRMKLLGIYSVYSMARESELVETRNKYLQSLKNTLNRYVM